MSLIGILSFQAIQAQAEDWPTFRGTGRTAVSAESGLLDSWPSEGPKLLWTAKGAGNGYASPAVVAGRVYTLGDHDNGQFLSCFDGNTGKLVWENKIGDAWNGHPRNPTWNGARATPTVDGDRVYVVDASGVVVCSSTSDGKVVWQKSLTKEFDGKKADSWGYSESPTIDGPLLICTPGGSKATVVALDKATGETRWTCARPNDEGAGHSSVVISYVGGRKIYVQNTAGGPMGIDAKSGQLLWTYAIKKPTAFIPSPIVKDDYVLSVAGYGTGGALIQQVASPDGNVSVKEVYGLNKDLDNKHGGVILIGNDLYAGFSDANQIYCHDLVSGAKKWRERGSGQGSTSVIAADGKLFIHYSNGVVGLAKASPEGFNEVSSFTAPGDRDFPSWAHLVVANGKLFVRDGDLISCYNIKK
jgi:outer membrane protein assembly factor BamB